MEFTLIFALSCIILVVLVVIVVILVFGLNRNSVYKKEGYVAANIGDKNMNNMYDYVVNWIRSAANIPATS